jgi:putative membrane protein
MFKALLIFLLNVFVVLALSFVLPNFEVKNFTTATIFLLVLSLLNWLIGPILEILSLPINFLTFGLASWLVNILLVWLATIFVTDVSLTGDNLSKFWSLFLVAIGLSLGHFLIENLVGKEN